MLEAILQHQRKFSLGIGERIGKTPTRREKVENLRDIISYASHISGAFVMTALSFPKLFSGEVELEHVGQLVDSAPLLDDVAALRQRMADDGYLYLPGLLDRAQVLEARRAVVERIAAAGYLNP